MNIDLRSFDFSLKELAIAGGRTVGIVGMNELTAPLIRYCSDLGYKITGVFDGNNPRSRNMDGLPVLPLQDIRTIKPDAAVLATFTSRKRIKEEINKLRGPIYKGLIIIAAGNDNEEFYNEKFKPIPEIERLHNLHKGQPAIIIGNGPSLLKTDPRTIINAVTFGCNSIFLLDGFAPTYYFVEDVLVAEDRASIINQLPWTKFFPNDLKKFLTNGTFFNADRTQWINFFSEDFALGIEMNATVTYTMLHAAFYFGCEPVYLIGVDHNYVVNNANIDRNNTVFTSKTDDPNHFHPDYFGKGLRWHDPRVDRMEAAYRLARRAYENASRRILNATAGGKLEVFERTSWEAIKKSMSGQIQKKQQDVKKVTILLCTPDMQSEITRRCLDSLFKNTYSRLYKLIIADNKRDEKFCHAHEMNKCLATLDTDFLVCLDDDVVLSPGWLEALLEVAERDPSVGAVGCVHTYADGSINHSGGTLYFSGGSLRSRQAVTPITTLEYTPYVCSACMLFRKTPLLFDETYAKYRFEVDYCYKLWESGLRVAVSPHSICHLANQQMLQRVDQNKDKIKEAHKLDEVVFSRIWYESGRLNALYQRIQDKLTHPDIARDLELPQTVAQTSLSKPGKLTEKTLLPLLIRERLKVLKATHKGRVIVFGAGQHTAWLEKIAGKNGALPKITAILDDKPEGKKAIFGLTPVKAAQFKPEMTDAIILSTDCFQKEMTIRCRELYGQQIVLIDLYQGLPPGPYDKN